MEIKKLRPPTKEERLKGLPTSREAAIEQGITRYFRGDEEYVIRNFGSKTAPQGRDTKASLRKASRGGGSQGSRKLYETLSTPPEAQTGQGRRDFGKAMVEARQKGLVGDHKYSVARTGNALKDMSPSRQALMHKRFRDAGIAIGNQVGNIEEVTEKVNYAKVGEERRLDKHLKNLDNRIRWNSKYSRFLMGAGAYSLLNTDSVEAASSMLSTGVNKDDTVQFVKGIGKDIAGQLTWAAAAKGFNGLGGTGLKYISPYAGIIAPIMLGYQAKNLGDAALQGAIGEDLKSQGEIAEAGKQYRKANGWSNGKNDRQNARHGTGLNVNREMIDDHNLVKAQGDDETESSLVEFQENYRLNQAMDKRMREAKTT